MGFKVEIYYVQVQRKSFLRFRAIFVTSNQLVLMPAPGAGQARAKFSMRKRFSGLEKTMPTLFMIS